MQLKLNPSTFDNTFVAPEEIAMEEEIEVEEVEEEEIAESLPPSEVVTEEIEAITEEVIETVDEEIIAETAVDEEEKLKESISNIPAPETSVSYRVQIAAGKKEVQQQYFVDRHKITENVTIEYHNTWYKYTIGSYPIYKEARDKRNMIWEAENKIDDAFVTAYNSGERISVQEALMISKQKWYK